MSEPGNQASKKRNKKRKKKGGKSDPGAGENGGEHTEKMPKQASDKEEQVITTAQCQRCKGTFQQMVPNGEQATSAQNANWMCPSCVQAIKAEEDKHKTSGSSSSSYNSVAVQRSSKEVQTPSINPGGCNCAACVAKRENAVPPEVERDAHITQTYWMEIRHIVRCIYRDNMSLSNQGNRATIGSDKMKMIVKKLCSRDPHQFFQRLETLAREYLLEVKVRLLEQLSCGFNSPQLAIEFIQMLLDEYTTLCNALPSLLYLLEPLEECDYVQKLGVTIELMNKNIFRELIFAESFMSSNLPLIIAQLRLASLASDPYHRNAADALSQRYISLDHEMDDISRIWRSAKDQLTTHQTEMKKQQERRAHFEKIKADGETFKMKQQMTSTKAKESLAKPPDKEHGKANNLHLDSAIFTIRPSERPPDPSANHKHSSAGPSMSSHTEKSLSNLATGSATDPAGLSPSELSADRSFKSRQAAEWSKLLFKCIKPVGEPEFRLNGDIATHTITLHLEMTELDLSGAEASCTREDLKRYRRLGLTLEEVVEVSMKLNALKGLGVNLKIEDLFDDEGFSLADVNDSVTKAQVLEAVSGDDVYFLDDKSDGEEVEGSGARSPLSEKELVDLRRARELILMRQETGNSISRQNDFLQGMTMKIRFMKRLTIEDLEKNFVADGGRVIFNSCDQVQMKLTQLELNSVRLLTTTDCIGNDLGLHLDGEHMPVMRGLEGGERSPEDYAFVHTDSHKEFMDLLLEKRKQLESNVSRKQREKRSAEKRAAEESKKAEDSKAMTKTDGKKVAETSEKEKEKDKEKDAEKESSKLAKTSSSGAKSSLASMTKLPNSTAMECGFKPVYLPNSSQPCQCSACVGAIAAIVTADHIRPLNPTDPSATTVTIKSSLCSHLSPSHPHTHTSSEKGKTDEKNKDQRSVTNGNKKPSTTTSALSKEGLWQNWMSTSGSAQLESEAHLHNGTPHSSHHHYSHYYHGDGIEGDSGYGDSLKSCLQSCECGHDHGAIPSGSPTPTYVSPYGPAHPQTGTSGYCTTGTNSSGNSEIPRRYCPCCYCELFGHNGPPTAPTSHNFTKQRDKMRQKLEEKKKKRDLESGKPASSGMGSDSRPVEELLAFIQGDEQEGQTSSKAAKRQRRKMKKQQLSHQDDDEPSLVHTLHSPHLDEELMRSVRGEGKAVRRDKGGEPGRKELQKRSKRNDFQRGGIIYRQPSPRGKMELNNGSGLDELSDDEALDLEDEFDGYDDELEAFKEFCFATAPVENKKKLAVALDMRDLMAKIK